MNTCESCEDYLTRRRTVLLPHIGRWVQRQKTNVPPAHLVERLVRAHHRNVCLHG